MISMKSMRAIPCTILLLISFIHTAICFCPLPLAPYRLAIAFSADPSLLLQPTMSLTSAAVEKAMAAAEREAKANGWEVTIAISDAGGMPLQVKRLGGAFPASFEVAVGKAKTAAHFRRSTGQLEAAANVADGSSRTALLSAPYVIMRGGLPVFIDGNCCGSVGVSGVKPDEDEQVAKAAVSVLESIPSSKL